jgi:hypothetical protein
MKNRMLGLLVVFAAQNASAAFLPADILSCLTSNTCLIGGALNTSVPGVTGYFMPSSPYDSTGASYLLRYDLAAPSQNTTRPTSYPDSAVTTPYSGALWVKAPVSLNPADTYHNFTIYTDSVSPVPHNSYNTCYSYNCYSSNHSTSSFDIGLTTADMLAGSGFVHGSGEPTYKVTGSLQRNMGVCIECSWGTDFNLIHLDYSSGTLQFNPDDPRTLLLSQGDSFPTYSNVDKFYVQSVPIPPAFFLFGTGLLGILRFRKKA